MKTVGECAGISEAELVEIDRHVAKLQSQIDNRIETRLENEARGRPHNLELAHEINQRRNREDMVATLRKLIDLARKPWLAALPDQHGQEGEECGQPKKASSPDATEKSSRSKTVKT